MVCGSVISGTTLSYKSGRELRPERVSTETLPQQLAAYVTSGVEDSNLVELFGQKEMLKSSESGRNRGPKLSASDLHKNATRLGRKTENYS